MMVPSRFYYKLQRVRSLARLVALRFMFGPRLKIGKSVGVRRGFVVNIPVAEARLRIGKNCSFNNSCSLNVRHSITIGENCIFGEGVRFYDHDHVFSSVERPIRDQGPIHPEHQ